MFVYWKEASHQNFSIARNLVTIDQYIVQHFQISISKCRHSKFNLGGGEIWQQIGILCFCSMQINQWLDKLRVKKNLMQIISALDSVSWIPYHGAMGGMPPD